MQSWDLSVLHWFNRLAGHSHAFDLVVAIFTSFAPLIFAVLFAYYFFADGTRRTRRTVLLSGLSGVLAIAVTAVLGHLLYRARPFAVLPAHQVHLLIPHALDSSFPSDHTMGSAAFAFGMWRAPNRSARVVFSITAIVVGLSRVVAGVHWPSDVVGSLLLGSAIAWGTLALERRMTNLLDWILEAVERAERWVGLKAASRDEGPMG